MRGAMAALTVEEADKILVELFGPAVVDYARAFYVKNGTLAIKCHGSAAGQEIKMNESKILAKINEKFGSGTVKKIRYEI